MSCPYYWYNYHYACRKTEKDVDEDTYYKYCRGYDYSDCAIYKGNDTSGCFLTSACMEAKGLPDDCHELTILRRFRDGYLKSQPCGDIEIAEYYRVAPQIVACIRSEKNTEEIFEEIYSQLVCPCVSLIEREDNAGAHDLYRSYIQKLRTTYAI